MKTIHLIFAVAITLGLNQNAFAKNDSLPNGRPFQIMAEDIQANSDAIKASAGLIAQHSELISMLINTAADIQQQIDNIKQDISALDARITLNKTDIENLSSQQAQLKQDVDDAVNRLQDAINANSADIAQLDLAVKNAVKVAEEARDNLATLVQQHNADIQQVLHNIDIMNTTLVNRISTIESQIYWLLSQDYATQGQFNALQSQINNLYGATNSLQSQINNLFYRYHSHYLYLYFSDAYTVVYYNCYYRELGWQNDHDDYYCTTGSYINYRYYTLGQYTNQSGI